MCVYVCGGQRSTLVSFVRSLLICFSRWGLPLGPGVYLLGLSGWSGVPKGLPIPPPHTGTMSPQHLFQTLHGFQGPNLGLLACTTSSSLTEPPPQPPV